MRAAEIDKAVSSMTVLVDTREHDTVALRTRCSAFRAPYRRECLSEGDYSAEYQIGEKMDAHRLPVVIERKMNLDELATCFTSSRERFCREMERAKEHKVRMYLIVENGSWESIYAGRFKSRMTPTSLVGSLLAWQARYELRIVFCKSTTTGKLIGDILRHELVNELGRKE